MESVAPYWPDKAPTIDTYLHPPEEDLWCQQIFIAVASARVNGLEFRRVATSHNTPDEAIKAAAARVQADYRTHLKDLGLVR